MYTQDGDDACGWVVTGGQERRGRTQPQPDPCSNELRQQTNTREGEGGGGVQGQRSTTSMDGREERERVEKVTNVRMDSRVQARRRPDDETKTMANPSTPWRSLSLSLSLAH